VLNDAVTLAPPRRPSEDFHQVGFKIYRPFFITFFGYPKTSKSNDEWGTQRLFPPPEGFENFHQDASYSISSDPKTFEHFL
jgi:hypothetical protein